MTKLYKMLGRRCADVVGVGDHMVGTLGLAYDKLAKCETRQSQLLAKNEHGAKAAE